MKKLYITVANNFWLCVFTYAATIMIASATFMIVEGFEFNRAVWFSFITSLTIGEEYLRYCSRFSGYCSLFLASLLT